LCHSLVRSYHYSTSAFMYKSLSKKKVQI